MHAKKDAFGMSELSLLWCKLNSSVTKELCAELSACGTHAANNIANGKQ